MTAPIGGIGRQLSTRTVTASTTATFDDYQILVNTAAGNATVTLFTAPGDGAFYQLVIQKTTSDANTVTVTDSTFTYTLTAQYDVVTVQLTQSGAWIGVAGFDVSGTGDVEGPASAVSANLASFSGTTGKIIQDSGVASAAVALAASSLRKEVTADVTNATATMSNITDLSVTLVAAGVYVGQVVFKCSDSTAAEGIAFDFDGSAATMTAFAAGAGVLTGGTSVASVTTSTAIATDLVWTTITNETWITIQIGLTVNAGGSFIPRFCQGTAHSAGTATVSRGSYLLLNRVS